MAASGCGIATSREKPPVAGIANQAGLILRETECLWISWTGFGRALRKVKVSAEGRDGGFRSNAEVAFISLQYIIITM